MIYLDNSATTFPKPPEVQRAVQEAMRGYSFNPGRGGYRQSLKVAERVYKVRELVRGFFNAPSAESVIFVPGCTQALNTVFKGTLRQGDHVIISSFEHNAVLRPLYKLNKQGMITYSVAKVIPGDDEATIQNFRELINKNTRVIVCTHASNVFGFRLPVERLCALAHSYDILFCLDAAQSAGLYPIDILNDGYDFVCCAGHKSLYGPMGIGLLLLGKNNPIGSLVEGGTGSISSEPDMPSFYPDRLEAGTLNIPGILGLEAGLRFVSRMGIDLILNKEIRIIKQLKNKLGAFEKIELYVHPDTDTPLLSFNAEGFDSETLSRYLSEKHDICVRGGLHCAPLAHRSMGTEDRGTVRISPSAFTTRHDIDALVNSMRKFS